MPEYYRNQYRSTPSRRVDGPVSMYPTQARKRRLAMLITVLATAGILVLGSLTALALGITYLVRGDSAAEGGTDQTAASETVGDEDPASSAATSVADGETAPLVVTDTGLAPLVDLASFRDAAYVPIKAVHVTSNKTTDKESMGRIMDIIDRTPLNAMVVAVKDDNGRVAFNSNAPMAVENDTINPIIWGGDMDGLLSTLAERNIVPIARIVCFKDDQMAVNRPDLAILNKNTGQPWTDYQGHTYLNPYSHEVWEYIVEVAEDAARRGFREIQFDYVRFPAGQDGDLSTTSYPGKYGEKMDAVADFLAYARPRLEALGVWVSADVFGYVVDTGLVKGIGQDLRMMSRNIDLICPMVYPDHYELGAYGIEYPPAEPYELVKSALAKTSGWVEGTGAKCRPWLQAHDDVLSRGVEYTPAMVEQEIKAAAELGFDEYLLWGGYPEVGI